MMEVTFDVLNMEGWLNDISSKYLTTIKVVDCMPWHRTGAQAIFEIQEGKGEQMIEEIRSHRDIEALDLEGNGKGKLTGTLVMKDCTIIRLINWAGCFLEYAKAEGNGRIEFKILAGREGSIPVLIRALGGMNLLVEIKQLLRYEESSVVTKKQRDLVKLALDKGYFDYPKRITIKELASTCDLAPSTLGETLHRAQKNILTEYFNSQK